MAYKQQKSISHSSGDWKSKIRGAALWVLMRTLYQVADSCFLVVFSHGGERENSPGSLIRALISFAALIFITLAAKVRIAKAMVFPVAM